MTLRRPGKGGYLEVVEVQRVIPSGSGDGACIGDGSGGPTKGPAGPTIAAPAPSVVPATPTHAQGEPRADVR
jgi:hypothetical protein